MAFSLPYPVYTIVDVARQIYQGEDPWFAMGCFLHGWWCHPNDDRLSFVVEPLPIASTLKDQQWAAFCAATVEELCLRSSLPCPSWTNQPDFFLADAWFYDSQPSQRDWLVLTTPEPYKRHNVFVGGNVLDNKYELKNIFATRPAWEIWSEEELAKYCVVNQE